jgi:beta-galactosidase
MPPVLMPDLATAPPPFSRTSMPLDDNWKFHLGDVAGSEAPAFDDGAFQPISLPHTWNAMDGESGPYYRGVGVYRRHLTVDSAFANKRIFLRFNGASMVAQVFLNGKSVGTHKGGFAAFVYDITALLDSHGDNVLAVKVNNAADPDTPPLSADFTFFGGLYRDVELIVTEPVHVDLLDYASPGVYLTTSGGDVHVAARVRNDSTSDAQLTVRAVVLDENDGQVASAEVPANVAAASTSVVTAQTTVASPHLWNGRSDPYLYRVRVEVANAGLVKDSVTQPLGFRTFSVDPNSGFSLNGQPLDLHGINRHQDRLDMGWAITNKEHDEDFALISELGATAMRLSHYQHAAHFYDLADAGGMVVWAEIPLINSINASAAFADNAKQQLIELIRQNYNHPCICFWSISNEIALMAGPDYHPLLVELASTVRTEDPTRLSTLGSNATNDHNITDLVGQNRYEGWYYGKSSDFGAWADQTHAAQPQQPLGISEFGAGASIHFHSEKPVVLDHSEEYQNLFHEAHWAQMTARPYLWAKFIWAMFDFASSTRNEGDTPARNDKGLVTYDRKTRKDAFYFYKANWTSMPFVYITSRRFAMRTANTIDIKVYGVADTVEVILNGTSLGQKSGTQGVFVWPAVPLAGGANVVIAKGTKGGQQTTSDTVTWMH